VQVAMEVRAETEAGAVEGRGGAGRGIGETGGLIVGDLFERTRRERRGRVESEDGRGVLSLSHSISLLGARMTEVSYLSPSFSLSLERGWPRCPISLSFYLSPWSEDGRGVLSLSLSFYLPPWSVDGRGAREGGIGCVLSWYGRG
jgi:hypothetical protein